MQDLWVVLLSSSRYYHNYRHFANTAAIYSIVKALGVQDDHIVLVDASDVLSDYRNLYRGDVFFDHLELFGGKRSLLYPKANSSSDLLTGRIDFRGEEVNIDLLEQLLLYKLPLSSSSKILFYLTGHGGEEFFKFHDFEEWNALNFSDLLQQLHYLHRYQEMLIILDTCKASTMVSLDLLLSYVPNTTVMASSLNGENSYSYYPHDELGLPIIDRFTYKLYEYFYVHYLKHLEDSVDIHGKFGGTQKVIARIPKRSKLFTINDLFRSIDSNFISSTPYLQYSKRIKKLPHQQYLLDFFSDFSSSDVHKYEPEIRCSSCYKSPQLQSQLVDFEKQINVNDIVEVYPRSNDPSTRCLICFLCAAMILWKLLKRDYCSNW